VTDYPEQLYQAKEQKTGNAKGGPDTGGRYCPKGTLYSGLVIYPAYFDAVFYPRKPVRAENYPHGMATIPLALLSPSNGGTRPGYFQTLPSRKIRLGSFIRLPVFGAAAPQGVMVIVPFIDG